MKDEWLSWWSLLLKDIYLNGGVIFCSLPLTAGGNRFLEKKAAWWEMSNYFLLWGDNKNLGKVLLGRGGGGVLVKMSRFNILTHKCIFQ